MTILANSITPPLILLTKIKRLYMPLRIIFKYGIILVFSLLQISCGGGSKLTIDEAKEVTLNFQGENFVPPPRGINGLIKKISKAKNQGACQSCEDLYLGDPDKERTLYDLSRMAIRYHYSGYTALASKAVKKGYKLLGKGPTNDRMDDVEKMEMLSRLSLISSDMGNFTDAIRYVEEAIDFNQQRMKPLNGRDIIHYTQLSEIHSEAGNIGEAESAFYNARDLFDSGISRLSASGAHKIPQWQLYLDIAESKIVMNQGKLREAEKRFRKILNSFNSGDLEYFSDYNVSSEASIRGYLLVEILLSQGRIAEAEAESRKAIEFSLNKFGLNSHATAKTIRGMIKVLMARNEYSDARRLVDVVEKIYTNLNFSKSSLDLARLNSLLIEIDISEGNWIAAENRLNSLNENLKSDPLAHSTFFNTNLNWAIVQASNGNIQSAEKTANQAYEYYSDLYGSSNIKSAIAKGILAMVYVKQGNIADGISEYDSVIKRVVESEGDDSLLTNAGPDGQLLSVIIESYLDVLNSKYKSGDKKSADKAFYIVQLIIGKGAQNAVAASAARSSIKNPQLISLVRQEQDASQKISASFNKIASLLSLETNKYNLSTITTLKLQVNKLRKAKESLLSEIRNRFPEYDNLVRPKPVLARDAKLLLQSGEALLINYSGNEKFYSWTLLHDGRVSFNVSKLSKLKLRSMVQTLRKGLDVQAVSLNEIPKFNTDLSYALYEKVLKPGVHLWRGAKKLIIVSDAVLGSLPFSVLTTEKLNLKQNNSLLFSNYRDIAWLAKSHATSYVPSIVTLKTLRNKESVKKATLRFAGFGNPDFGRVSNNNKSNQLQTRGMQLTMRGLRRTSVGSLDDSVSVSTQIEMLNSLPETADEVLQVARALQVKRQGNVFLGKNADEERIKKMILNNRRILMFASHALLPGDLDGLTQPAIAFSAPKVTGSKNDGLLTMSEIMGLDLNADWVVLSACNTGAASGKGASAISGLGQAFFYAGARSLLVSHWPVETTSAKEITIGLFEKQVKNQLLTRAVALNETVKDLIHYKTYKDNSGADIFSYAHPFFWAPFTVVGDGAGILN